MACVFLKKLSYIKMIQPQLYKIAFTDKFDRIKYLLNQRIRFLLKGNLISLHLFLTQINSQILQKFKTYGWKSKDWGLRIFLW